MNERLLQFIWQFQYFNKNELTTTDGDRLEIKKPGIFNRDQGPDFSGGAIIINEITWAGTIELHMKTSDWNRHGHSADKNYNAVILHVVWENDAPTNDIPVLELKERVSKLMLDNYASLMHSSSFVSCENQIMVVNELTWESWKERLVAERLQKRSLLVEQFLEQNSYHWEETFWWMLARNFGLKVNADAFESMARSIPLNVLAKHKNQLQQVEALLFGQAGLLHTKLKDAYAKLLQREHQFLKKKYGLKNIFHPIHFLRMRPGNFPTIRLAQLAALISESAHLFSRIKEAPSLQDVTGWLNVQANDYWHYHYRFDVESAYKIKTLGRAMIDNILINTVTPVLFKHGDYLDEDKYKEKAIRWMHEISPEKNFITEGFQQLGVKNISAFDSQALLELKKEYCDVRRCLECSVGNQLLKPKGLVFPS